MEQRGVGCDADGDGNGYGFLKIQSSRAFETGDGYTWIERQLQRMENGVRHQHEDSRSDEALEARLAAWMRRR